MLDFLRIYNKNNELNNFYISIFIRKLGLSLISIFVPIYLYKIGFSITKILFFYLILSISFISLSYLGGKIISKIGKKHAILLSAPITILVYIGLIFIKDFNILFYIIPIISAISNIFYNISYHLIFTRHSHDKTRSSEIALIGILAIIAGIISPYIGGIIAEIDFSTLFIISSLLIAISSIPLFFTKDTYEKVEFSTKKLFRKIFQKENKGNFISFSSYGIERIIDAVIWPIFIIIIIKDIEKTGLIISLSTILSILIYYFFGKISDKLNKLRLIKMGSYLYSLSWIIRLFSKNFYSVLATDSFKNVSQKILRIPWEAHTYELTKRTDYLEFIIMKENIFNISRIIIFTILIPIFYFDFYPFTISIILGGVFSLGYQYIKK